jgi:hypothetical protein
MLPLIACRTMLQDNFLFACDSGTIASFGGNAVLIGTFS